MAGPFYYEYAQLIDKTWDILVFDRRRGDDYLAACGNVRDAEKIVTLLNAAEPKPAPLGIFG